MIDPNSEGSDFVIGQSKFCNNISSEQVLNAVRKMADFYKDMLAGHYERVNAHVQRRFITLNAEMSDEAKFRFVFYTSAPQPKNFDGKRIEDDFCKQFPDRAAIVNASAFSIKKLYKQYGKNLLSLNLRYHIAERKSNSVDNHIENTINNDPASFWLKNNGITIICDDFRIDGCEVHLENFSIVNDGQTTHVLSKSNSFDATHDFWLSCKIIKTAGVTKDEKNAFSLEIAQAANSQKPITKDDLKTNAPEQISFAQSMRQIGVFYETKRGDKDENKNRPAYLRTKLKAIGNLCLAAIFQMPGVDRNSRTLFHKDRYYRYIFIEKQAQVAKICKELLYINNYFKETFEPKFKRENKNDDDAKIRTSFASNARTICIAFTALAARYHQDNITDETLKIMFTVAQANSDADALYKAVRDIGEMQSLLPKKFLLDMDLYDAVLDKLFEAIIESGILVYSFACDDNPNLTATNFLKSDKSYYAILKKFWSPTLKKTIREVFADV